MNVPSTQTSPLALLPQPEPGAGESLDLIFIEGLVAQTVIGIFDNELHDPQPVRIDLHAGVPRVLACSSDRIHDTIDYGVVRSAVLELLATHRLQLLEALAEAIAQMLLNDFRAQWVRIAVAKPRKFEDVEAVGVVIERRRAPGAAPADVLSLMGAGLVPSPR